MVGDVDPESVHSKLQLQRPVVRIRDPSTNTIVRTEKPNVPDLVSLHATLKFSAATLSYFFRLGQPWPGTPALTWSINFEHGEIRLVSFNGLGLDLGQPATIHVHWHESDEVEEVKWEHDPELAALPPTAKNVITTLLAFADGKTSGDGWVSLEDAAGRARLIEGLLSGWEKEQK